MKRPRIFVTPKRLLFYLHRDLEQITETVEGWNQADLSDFEVLVLILEDRRFFQHHGVDLLAVVRELVRMFSFRKHGGASTIDMQFVRTKTGYRAKTFKRKCYEIILAYFLQFRMHKLAILRSYLDIMYLGSGLRGAYQASETVFAKQLWELDRREAAFIAAMMVYPRPLVPTAEWSKKVYRRAAYGLRLFDDLASRYKQRLE